MTDGEYSFFSQMRVQEHPKIHRGADIGKGENCQKELGDGVFQTEEAYTVATLRSWLQRDIATRERGWNSRFGIETNWENFIWQPGQR